MLREFDVVVLGGEGSTVGMVFGALILGLITNGLNLLNVDFFYQEVFKGLLLIIAVLIDRKIKGKLLR